MFASIHLPQAFLVLSVLTPLSVQQGFLACHGRAPHYPRLAAARYLPFVWASELRAARCLESFCNSKCE
jgi:hypothetical protein